ncbi:MAG: TetR family transcriptional regulator, partial [Candidatus Dormibacteraeota bacterium]|nr:TetR family transcriptional regulator [Candidatus Dormibacteraeota bacterium]
MSSVPPAAAEAEVARYRHGRVPRAVRERQVIAAAETLFSEQGFVAASMDELSR